jgi:L-threonylcarbamoyladenylate synthase
VIHLRLDPADLDVEALTTAATTLRNGGIVAYPTDTLYGLAVDPRNDGAIRRLFDVKGRDEGAAVALIAADAAQAEQAGTFGLRERKLAAEFWPGPLTIVVPMSAGMSALLSNRRTLGVRVPDHPVARGLAVAFGGCITATSANRSGRPAAMTADEVAAALGEVVDVILDSGPVPGGAASTVVEIVDGIPTLHRAGATSWDRVLRCLE